MHVFMMINLTSYLPVLIYYLIISNALLFMIRLLFTNCDIVSHMIAYTLAACVYNYDVAFRLANVIVVIIIFLIMLKKSVRGDCI